MSSRRPLWFCLLAIGLLGACRSFFRPGASSVPADANFVLTASDAVASAAQDEDCYLAVFVDGKAAGQTAVALKSKEKAWGEVLPVGNHLFRFEEWVKPPSGQWTPLPADWQPTERFIRVEPGLRTVVSLKFYDAGRRHSLEISRFPLTVLP